MNEVVIAGALRVHGDGDALLHHHEVKPGPASIVAIRNTETRDDRGDIPQARAHLNDGLRGDFADAVRGHHASVVVSKRVGFPNRPVYIVVIDGRGRTVKECLGITF